MLHQELAGFAFFYGFTTVLFGLWLLAGYTGIGRSYRSMEAMGASTSTYRVFEWVADRWRPIAVTGTIAFVGGLSVGLAVEASALSMIGHGIALFGYTAAFLGVGSVPIARKVEEARAKVQAGQAPPKEAESAWRRGIAPAIGLAIGVAVLWSNGLLQAHPWLWILVVLGALQVGYQVVHADRIARWISHRIDRLFGLDDP